MRKKYAVDTIHDTKNWGKVIVIGIPEDINRRTIKFKNTGNIKEVCVPALSRGTIRDNLEYLRLRVDKGPNLLEIGEKFYSRVYGYYKVIKVLTRSRYTIKFTRTGYETDYHARFIKEGNVIDKSRLKIFNKLVNLGKTRFRTQHGEAVIDRIIGDKLYAVRFLNTGISIEAERRTVVAHALKDPSVIRINNKHIGLCKTIVRVSAGNCVIIKKLSSHKYRVMRVSDKKIKELYLTDVNIIGPLLNEDLVEELRQEYYYKKEMNK